METAMGRRVFFGSVVAGLPLLTYSGSRALAQSAGDIHAHTGMDPVDPLVDHLAREMARLHNAIRRDPRGEYLRGFAAQLRNLAIYSRQTNVDTTLATEIRALVEKEGRDALLYRTPDRDHVVAELKRYGAQVDERLLNVDINLDHAARVATFDRFLRTGISTTWEQIASTLERLAPELDRRAASGLLRVNRRQDAAYWEGYCKEIWSQYSETQFLAGVICATAALPVIGVAFGANCIAYQLAAVVFAMCYATYCWNV